MTATILVVDDDVSVTASLELLLKQSGFRSVVAAEPAAALDVLRQRRIDLVIQDMNFSRSTTGEEGLELLRRIRRDYAALPVVLITAWGSIALAVEGMKAGAADFVTKPWNNDRIVQVLNTALSLFGERPLTIADRESLDKEFELSQILGRDPALVRVLDQLARVAKTDATVLITGESGTGKELFANAIHANSHRAGGPLVKVNMGAIVPSLFESEMFGATASDTSNRPTAERSFSTRSPRSTAPRRSSSCAFCRTKAFSASGKASGGGRTSAWWRRRTAISGGSSPRVNF